MDTRFGQLSTWVSTVAHRAFARRPSRQADHVVDRSTPPLGPTPPVPFSRRVRQRARLAARACPDRSAVASFVDARRRKLDG